MSPRSQSWASAALLLLLAACTGGGGGGSPTVSQAIVPDPPVVPDPPSEPVAPSVPTDQNPDADDPVMPGPPDGQPPPANAFANPLAVDPTASFRSIVLPAHREFQTAAEAPDTPVTVLYPAVGADAPTAPSDLLPMTHRAAHLWTRRMAVSGTHHVDLLIGSGPGQDPCSSRPVAACGLHGGILMAQLLVPDADLDPAAVPNARIELPDDFLTSRTTGTGQLSLFDFGVLVHEFGHTFNYRDEHGRRHPDCAGPSTQIMCPHGPAKNVLPDDADFAGLRVVPTTGPTDHQDFGLWAAAPGVSGLDRFGVRVTRTVTVTNRTPARVSRAAASYITDTIAIQPHVDGTPSAGPAAGLGTATWSGLVLGAHTTMFQPVTGTATLTADLADLSSLDLALTALERTDGDGGRHALAPARYDLQRRDDTWTSADGTADARFYASGADAAGAAAGTVHDPDGAHLIGAWGAVRD